MIAENKKKLSHAAVTYSANYIRARYVWASSCFCNFDQTKLKINLAIVYLHYPILPGPTWPFFSEITRPWPTWILAFRHNTTNNCQHEMNQFSCQDKTLCRVFALRHLRPSHTTTTFKMIFLKKLWWKSVSIYKTVEKNVVCMKDKYFLHYTRHCKKCSYILYKLKTFFTTATIFPTVLYIGKDFHNVFLRNIFTVLCVVCECI